jgi:uncharacterized protein YqiB (DUF1249 family)
MRKYLLFVKDKYDYPQYFVELAEDTGQIEKFVAESNRYILVELYDITENERVL